jgi:sugar lactone lactonase YvrE
MPSGIAVDKVGNTWVSLQYQCQVRRYAPDWTTFLAITLVSPCDNGAGAGGTAVDATGTLYVTVRTRPDVRGVYAVHESGASYRLPGTGAMAFDHNNGALYITDSTLGQVWRILPGGTAGVWLDHPSLKGQVIPANGMLVGANGIVVDKDSVIVSVSFLPRLVRIPINRDGSAGQPQIIVDQTALFPRQIMALDDIALDVFGNIYAAVVGGARTVLKVSGDGRETSTLGGFDAAALSIAFGTGKGERKSLFVGINQAFGGSGSGVVRVDAGVPGRPIP